MSYTMLKRTSTNGINRWKIIVTNRVHWRRIRASQSWTAKGCWTYEEYIF
ncbi:hypothetical protein TNCV_3209471, partial [Trichonephila clavipes]